MILAHYVHPLPADYDVALIRERARQRGPLWDAAPDLHFKAFLLRERGQFGAAAGSYSSLYLWRHDGAFRDFLVNGRYRAVTDRFGRADIQTRLVLDARKGPGRAPRFAYREDLDIPLDADLTAILHAEMERNAAVAGRPGTVATAVGVDTKDWKLTRILLSELSPSGNEPGVGYTVLHLAAPLLGALP
ncbi:DUF4865 family protein [Ralstonia solanacearum]|uniref:DUF4865 family protein n=1 Tax=Ralstonia solanacearum TaxID=305 RepID=UPI00050208EA|nr:DUF4865 family protein [Ralstonia solanacearum]KFX29301.1 hypothetical protein KR96_08005 [Ralstonia solanacearum]